MLKICINDTIFLGNLDTLKYGPSIKDISVREILLEFHRKYYSAESMKLVMLGRG
jgi:insulysin